MKYYVTTKDIADTLETSLYQARKIFLNAKCKSKLRFSEREVQASIVNQIIGYKAFAEPQEER
jgi:hypothetical protein